MTATPAVSVLEVFLSERRVGTLTHLPGERNLFAFDDQYVNDPRRPTLSLSFKAATGGLITQFPTTRIKLPPFFSNLLPEGHLLTYLADLGRINPEREFFLLWLLGHDLPGAVTVRPADGETLPPTTRTGPAGAPLPTAAPLRFSLAGVQLKFSAVMEASGGLTIPTEGMGGSWIAKLPSKRFEAVPENEFAMMTLARDVGIEVPEIQLVPTSRIEGLPEDLPENFGRTLAIRRFDRGADSVRTQIEDFAQVFNVFPDSKYKHVSYRNIAEVIWAETGENGVAEFVRRLAFNAFIGNADMHLKNWSLIYRDGRTAALAPAYDLVATVAYIRSDEMALSLAGTKAMYDVSKALFARFAAKARLPESVVVDTALETAGRFHEAWRQSASVKDLPKKHLAKIETHMKTVPLLNEQ